MTVPPAGEPEESALPPDLRVPNDASELAFEAEALRRERRAAARRDWLAARVATRRYQRYGLSGPIVVGCLLVVAVFGSLLALFGPRTPGPLPPQRLADPSAAAGAEGALLPDVELAVGTRELSIREVRPAMLVLLPAACQCRDVIRALVNQAQEFRLRSRLVWAGEPTAAQAALIGSSSRGLATALTDPTGTLADTYSARGVTVLLVAADGVVRDVVRDVRAGVRLESRLQVLVRPV